MPTAYLLDLQYRTVRTCRRVVMVEGREEAEALGARLAHSVDIAEFEDDPRYPDVAFCACVMDLKEVADRISVALHHFPGLKDQLRSLLDAPPSAIWGGLDDR